MKKFIKIALFFLIIALLVIGAVKLVKKRKAEEAALPIAKEYAVIAPVMEAKKSHLLLTTNYLALVQSEANTKLLAKFAGRIEWIAKEGAHLAKGDLVVKLDSTPLQTKLTSLKAQIEAVKKQIEATKEILDNLYKIHKRTQKLLQVRGASKEEYEKEANEIAKTKTNLYALKGKLANLQANKKELLSELNYAILKSPIDGVLAKRYANRGDIAMPGHPLVAIASPKDSYLLVRLPKDIKIYGVFYKNRRYNALPLLHSYNSLNEYKVAINDPQLIAGERVEVEIITFDGKGTLLPQDAILNRDGKSYILIAKGNKATPKEVKIIASGEKGVVIEDNIEGQKVVIAKPDILLKLLSGIELKPIKRL